MNELKNGIIIGNSVLSSRVAVEDHYIAFDLNYNPPYFLDHKNGLVSFGKAVVNFLDKDGESLNIVKTEVLDDDYPRLVAKLLLSNGVSCGLKAFAPIDAEKSETMFLPAILLQFSYEGILASEIITKIEWDISELGFDKQYGWMEPSPQSNHPYSYEKFFIRSMSEQTIVREQVNGGKIEFVQQDREPFICMGYFSEKARWRTKVRSVDELCSYILGHFEHLAAAIDDWVDSLPRIGDQQIFQYTRWYSQAAVLLTKADDTGRVITMGYKELNQRDSFWTSYIHLVFWPELEKTMIRESCQWQKPNGKIPTTILPLYDREVDIDINEYFCLRISRYFRYYRDYSFLRECWPHYLRSIEFLLTLDRDGDSIPEQAPPEEPLNFWADWKDVIGISGRKLAPHFVLLWKSALQEGIDLAKALQDTESQERLQSILAEVDKYIDQDDMWNENYFGEVWYDATMSRQMSRHVLIDQTLAIPFEGYPRDKIAPLYQKLNENETPAGIPETYPYREDMEYEKGKYHNGGIWPYLVFADAMGRFMTGYHEDAKRLIKKIGYYDLEFQKDWAPNEYLDAITFNNEGFPIQGWSSALFGALSHGAFHIEWTDDYTLEVNLNLGKCDFMTYLHLPYPFGKVRLERKNDVMSSSFLSDGKYRLKIN